MAEAAVTALESDAADPEPAPVTPPVPTVRGGRHRRGAPVPSAPAGAHHAVAETPAPDPAELAQRSQLLVAETPKDADGKPDIEVLAGALMAQLESSESRRTALPGWDRVPGGKWTVLAGGMVALTLILVGVSAVLGAIFVH